MDVQTPPQGLVCVERRLSDVAHELCDGDLGLARGKGFGVVSRLVSVYGRGPYSHALRIGRAEGNLYAVEMREWYGGRMVLLAALVDHVPGRIDVYRPNRLGDFRYSPHGAWREMLTKPGKLYNYWGVLKAGARSFPGVRFFLGNQGEGDEKGPAEKREHCSQAISSSDRIGGGFDPVAHTKDAYTEPNDLWRSPLYADGYLFTLMP
jgi:hypothetical protein